MVGAFGEQQLAAVGDVVGTGRVVGEASGGVDSVAEVERLVAEQLGITL